MLYSRPECPVGDFDREWIHNALIWFEQRLGKDFVQNGKHLIPAHFKLKYQHFNSQEAIQYFIEFICGYIDFDASLIDYRLLWEQDEEIVFEDYVDSEELPAEQVVIVEEYTLTEEGKYLIDIDESQLNDFDGSFVSLLYKLTYVKLLHQKIFAFENKYMVNFAMVLMGFGVLIANVFIRTQQWRGLKYSAWKVRREGVLNHRMYGYLFAVLSNYRSNEDESWQQYLCNDAANYYRQALGFLEEGTGLQDILKRRSTVVKDEEVFIYKEFYDGGAVQLTTHIINGKFEGKTMGYYYNGMLWHERIYRSGNPYTVISSFNPYDEPVEKGTLFEGNGTLYIYKSDGNLDYIEEYKDGVKVKETYHKD